MPGYHGGDVDIVPAVFEEVEVGGCGGDSEGYDYEAERVDEDDDSLL